jgi:crossover junction endodeoxyribonuclease RuvC
MMILGVDPGYDRVGWALVDTSPKIHAHAFGSIQTSKNTAPEERLLDVYTDIMTVFTTYKPDCVAIEDLFFTNNAKTVIPVGQARGVIMLACAQNKKPIYSYTPSAIKRAIAGYGRADKKQVEKMVQSSLNIKSMPTLDDTTDALAVGLTHAYTYKMKGATI